jgi:peptidoglycan hydrolase-like protein with peptidoglycan-binding domain
MTYRPIRHDTYNAHDYDLYLASAAAPPPSETERPARYTPGPSLEAVDGGGAVLRFGHRGAGVREAQAMLNDALPDAPKLAVDGLFGPKTRAAVRDFQAKVGLPVTGELDVRTSEALLMTPARRSEEDRVEVARPESPVVAALEAAPDVAPSGEAAPTLERTRMTYRANAGDPMAAHAALKAAVVEDLTAMGFDAADAERAYYFRRATTAEPDGSISIQILVPPESRKA